MIDNIARNMLSSQETME